VDLKNKPKDLLELNPYGKVPVLVDGGVLYESAIINEYLDERYPALPLLPREPLQRAKVRICVDFFNSRVHSAAHDISRGIEPDKARARMLEHLAMLEREMADKKYIMGDYSLADVTFIPFYTRRERYGVVLDGQFPRLRRWGEELLGRPAVASTL
jgi:glutathione S-transferase